MNINSDMINQLIGSIPFPIEKTELVKMAKQHGANDQMANMLNRLPDKKYNNADELKGDFSSMMGGKMGNLGNLGGSSKI